MLFALGAAASWAFYILASARVGREFPRLDGLALAMTVGALIALPFGILSAGSALLRPDLLALGAAVAVLSSTIPYALELIALRRLPAAAFAILMSLAPATAALAGWLLLGQELVVARAGRHRAGDRREHRRGALLESGRLTIHAPRLIVTRSAAREPAPGTGARTRSPCRPRRRPPRRA